MEEMVSDTLDQDGLLEDGDEEAESEVDKVLSEVLKERMPSQATPSEPVQRMPEEAEEEDLDSEEMLAQMRGRLEA
ncbi:Vacuolar protein-sorting-associated protein 24, partial [Teratosphaeriaceae sp. CCFEE 6253]